MPFIRSTPRTILSMTAQFSTRSGPPAAQSSFSHSGRLTSFFIPQFNDIMLLPYTNCLSLRTRSLLPFTLTVSHPAAHSLAQLPPRPQRPPARNRKRASAFRSSSIVFLSRRITHPRPLTGPALSLSALTNLSQQHASSLLAASYLPPATLFGSTGSASTRQVSFSAQLAKRSCLAVPCMDSTNLIKAPQSHNTGLKNILKEENRDRRAVIPAVGALGKRAQHIELGNASSKERNYELMQPSLSASHLQRLNYWLRRETREVCTDSDALVRIWHSRSELLQQHAIQIKAHAAFDFLPPFFLLPEASTAAPSFPLTLLYSLHS